MAPWQNGHSHSVLMLCIYSCPALLPLFVPGNPDCRASAPARRTGQARRFRGNQGRDQVHQLQVDCFWQSITPPTELFLELTTFSKEIIQRCYCPCLCEIVWMCVCVYDVVISLQSHNIHQYRVTVKTGQQISTRKELLMERCGEKEPINFQDTTHWTRTQTVNKLRP